MKNTEFYQYAFVKLADPNNSFDRTKLIMKSNSITVSDLLEDFREFLLACGYQIKGDLIVDEHNFKKEEV